VFEHDGMAGNVPARSETHTPFGIGEYLHTLGIERVETGIGENLPMRPAEIVQTLQLSVGFEIPRSLGKGLETVEEVAQSGFEMRQQEVAVVADQGCGTFIEAGKAETSVKASTFAPVIPCRCRYLNQAQTSSTQIHTGSAGGLSTMDDAGHRAERREIGLRNPWVHPVMEIRVGPGRRCGIMPGNGCPFPLRRDLNLYG
jgi:hypothetical protein